MRVQAHEKISLGAACMLKMTRNATDSRVITQRTEVSMQSFGMQTLLVRKGPPRHMNTCFEAASSLGSSSLL